MAGDLMTGQEIYENFAHGRGPRDLIVAAEQIAQVEALYNLRAEQIKTLAASMEEGWTGAAAGAAQRGAGPLAVEHAGAAEAMSTARQLLVDQATGWSDTKARVQPVPPLPDSPNTLEAVLTMGKAIRDYESQVRRSNEAAQANAAAMSTWTSISGTNSYTMPSSYGQIDPSALAISMKQPEPAPHVGGGARHTATGGDHGTTTPGASNQDQAVPTPPGNAPPGTVPPGTLPPGALPSDDGTRTTSYAPPPPTPFDHPSPGPGLLPRLSTGPGDGPGGFGPVPGPGGYPTGGGGGAGASGRAGGGQAGAGARGTGGGARTGAGGPGETTGRGAGPVRGTAGRPGSSGMGGMPPGGKGGKTEDEEHQRKYVLDDDEPFQLGTDGEHVIDPRTGLPPAPPVIGE